MKKTVRDNYRLEVHPDTYRERASVLTNHDLMQNRLREIMRGVERHVDDVRQIVPMWDTRDECSHCGSIWEELSEGDAAQERADGYPLAVAGEPVCCGKAVEEFRAERGIPLLETS